MEKWTDGRGDRTVCFIELDTRLLDCPRDSGEGRGAPEDPALVARALAQVQLRQVSQVMEGRASAPRHTASRPPSHTRGEHVVKNSEEKKCGILKKKYRKIRNFAFSYGSIFRGNGC